MDSWEKFDETSLPNKEAFYSSLYMLLMVKKGIRGGICHAIHRYARANSRYLKNYNKNEEPSFLEYLDANNLYGWAMIEPLPLDGFKWVRNDSKIDEDFIKKTMIRIVIKDIYLK